MFILENNKKLMILTTIVSVISFGIGVRTILYYDTYTTVPISKNNLQKEEKNKTPIMKLLDKLCED
jgi:hypothetical protein